MVGKAAAQPEIFQGRGGFAELGHFDKLFVKNTKKAYAGKYFGGFSPIQSLSYSLNGRFKPRMDTIRTFFPKSGTFFDFQKG